MDLLLDSRKKIMAIDNNITFGVFDEPIEKWKAGNIYFIDCNYTKVSNIEVPIDIIPNKYFYIDGSFVIDPNYNNSSMEVSELKQQLSGLNTQMNERLGQTELEVVQNDFRLCLLELNTLPA